MQLRDYQARLKSDIYASWNAGNRNVLARLPTGGGKTVVFSSIIHEHQGASCAVAHRKELVGQMAMALAREQVHHRIIGPQMLVKYCIREQMQELGRSYFNPNARTAVAGINTLVNRGQELAAWMQQVTLWVQDEAHHVLKENVWGKGIAMFPNARGLGVTATPGRADGKGLGRDSHGVFDDLVSGPEMRELIDAGYLTDYRVFCPQSDIDLASVPVSDATGDYSQPKLKQAVRESHIVGDVVEHYLRIAPGKLGVVFATDVETATDMAVRFRSRGVVAEVVSAETPDDVRSEIIRRFRRREITVLVNVDLFGEGFDLPAIEVVMFARPTMSYGLYCQQFGRALRLMAGKLYAIIIDHVGNIVRHGLPDRPRAWSLSPRERAVRGFSDPDEIKLKPCVGSTEEKPGCTKPYERHLSVCPYCGATPPVAVRGGPEFVDGNLLEVDPAILAQMRAAVAVADRDAQTVAQGMLSAGASHAAASGAYKNILLKQEAQHALRLSMAWWAGWQQRLGLDDAEQMRRFYLAFGVDVMTAQALGRSEALALQQRINEHMGRGYR